METVLVRSLQQSESEHNIKNESVVPIGTSTIETLVTLDLQCRFRLGEKRIAARFASHSIPTLCAITVGGAPSGDYVQDERYIA